MCPGSPRSWELRAPDIPYCVLIKREGKMHGLFVLSSTTPNFTRAPSTYEAIRILYVQVSPCGEGTVSPIGQTVKPRLQEVKPLARDRAARKHQIPALQPRCRFQGGGSTAMSACGRWKKGGQSAGAFP